MSKSLLCVCFLGICAVILTGCIGTPKPADDQPFEFLDMELPTGDGPQPTEVKPQVKTEVPKVFREGRVQEYRKTSKIAVINIGSSTHGIKKGITGKLYSDAAKTRQIGLVDLTVVHSAFCEGAVRNLTFEIDLKKMEVIAVFEVEE